MEENLTLPTTAEELQKAIDEDLTANLFPAEEELNFNAESFCKKMLNTI